MWNNFRSRQDLVGVILLLYFLPIVFICAYSTLLFPQNSSWSTLAVGLLLAAVGGILFFGLLLNYEETLSASKQLSPSIHAPEVEDIEEEKEEEEENAEEENTNEQLFELQEQIEQLQEEIKTANKKEESLTTTIEERDAALHEKLEEIKQQTIRSEEEQQKYLALADEFKQYKLLSEKQLEQEKQQNNETHETISEMRATIDHKQNQIEKLETKIHDLTYEIKTLLQIADLITPSQSHEQDTIGSSVHQSAQDYQLPMEELHSETEDNSPLQVSSGDEAKTQLKRCIDIAQKITGSQHFARNRSRFGELSLDNYALDLRRLCDSLRSENSCTVLVYSPKDNKPIFINNQIKELLGWNPEKFVQDFDNIVQEGIFEWKNSISQLNTLNQAQTRLVLKSKTGRDLLVHCQLGLIPTGVFRSNVIGVLYPA
ncbi:MAG: hypothetical protein VX777_09515 [Chlamydiota bacterium]|nr:hypothetical protein [Chlamydiota bacterium]